MAKETKRKRQSDDASKCKKPKVPKETSLVRRDLLQHSYESVATLRAYALSQLPSTSRIRRKKITALGRRDDPDEAESPLSDFLDTTLICTNASQIEDDFDVICEQFQSYSQNSDESYLSESGGISAATYTQAVIVDFVIWRLVAQPAKPGARSDHLLSDGFRRGPGSGGDVLSKHPNANAQAVREGLWPHLLALLGRSGAKIMLHLLLNCSIYLTVNAGQDNYYQISGVPLTQVDIGPIASSGQGKGYERKLSEIILVRNRIFYAKPALTARGAVLPGFKDIHVLNRCSLSNQTNPPGPKESTVTQRNEASTIKVMMYIFPRQFGLHNVFNSKTDTSMTAQKFHDYTSREEEIAALNKGKVSESRPPKLPKRLRGLVKELVQGLQVLHGRCSYVELQKHYCPTSLDQKSQSKQPEPSSLTCGGSPAAKRQSQQVHPPKPSAQHTEESNEQGLTSNDTEIISLASPVHNVSVFCQTVLAKIIPDGFWGEDDIKRHNKAAFLQKIDHFIKLRRFESMSMVEIAHGFKIKAIPWLQISGQTDQKSSLTDTNKRVEIFNEFLYYVFDSLLIPLIRSSFYVTESNTHRYQVFYFRHDIWRLIAEPAMSLLKEDMLEEMRTDEATRILGGRKLGFSQLRLLPKKTKLRPITNLRRRNMIDNGSKKLGPSVNSVMGPVHSLLKLEKDIHPSRLGATMFSVGDSYRKLKKFKEYIGPSDQRFYFAKLDVKAAFDTIPQNAVIDLMRTVPSQRSYTIAKHAEVKPGERLADTTDGKAVKPIRRWQSGALPEQQPEIFVERLENSVADRKKNTVFIESVVQYTHESRALMALLQEHIEQNLVKVGKKFYRQRKGIPQGSVVSSFLCNYFYADLEARHLSFLDTSDCLLLRLIDDFLLITLDRSKAERFVETMHRGVPEYGVEVSHAKTLVNFNMSIGGDQVAKIGKGIGFPYCGTLINCDNLEITKNLQREKGVHISTSLTVEFGRLPGQNFQRKVLNAFKIQSHAMFFDTAHNSVGRVLESLHAAFGETAKKMWSYIRCLPAAKQPHCGLIIRTIGQVADVAYALLTQRSRTLRHEHYAFDIHKAQVVHSTYSSFIQVLEQRQTGYSQVIAWLRAETSELSLKVRSRNIPRKRST